MTKHQSDHFILENAEQVQTAYLAAVISEDAEELEEELSFYVSFLAQEDLRFEASGDAADLFKRQAIESLTYVRDHAPEHPHLIMAANGLLKTLIAK